MALGQAPPGLPFCDKPSHPIRTRKSTTSRPTREKMEAWPAGLDSAAANRIS